MTQSRCTLDPGSPYAALKLTLERGYWLCSLRSHPISPEKGKLRVHRAVCYDKCAETAETVCGLCGMADLDWHCDRNDDRYVHVDHIDGNGSNNRARNLRPTHKWCNDNRPIVEGYRIGWERWKNVPIAQRPALRISAGPNKGAPTSTARKLANDAPFPVQIPLEEAAEAETVDETPKPPPQTEPEALRDGFPAWIKLRDGKTVMGPPIHILDRFGCLKGLSNDETSPEAETWATALQKAATIDGEHLIVAPTGKRATIKLGDNTSPAVNVAWYVETGEWPTPTHNLRPACTVEHCVAAQCRQEWAKRQESADSAKPAIGDPT